jgi:hypothetical protein
VQTDSLFAVEGKSKLAVTFARPQKFTHYRLKLNNNLEQISFRTVNLVYSIELSEETWFIESIIPKFTVESGNRETRIIIEDLKHLRLCDLHIETDSMFLRNVRAPGSARKELYHLAINDAVYNDTTLPLNRYISRNDTYIVIIEDGDDRPISIKSIMVRYYADDLVFEGGPVKAVGETYTLEFGNDSVKTAPVYDIGRYRNEILKTPVDSLSLGPIQYTEAAPERHIIDPKVIFNIVVIIIALLLGALIVFKLKR